MSDLHARVAMLERMIAALSRRHGASVAFARSTLPPVDTGPVQTVQGQMDALSRRDNMPVLFHYGFTSAMPVGGDKVVTYLNGDRSSGVVVATGHQTYRLTGLRTGEVALYDMWGRSIHLGAAGITINCGGVPMTITGDLNVTGNVTAGYGTVDPVGLRTHYHHTGSVGADTSPPVPDT